MNERIQKLAEQCFFTKDKYGLYWDENANADGVDLEKFAELIVRECANICFSEAQGHSMAFGEHCGIVIKEHFRVEE